MFLIVGVFSLQVRVLLCIDFPDTFVVYSKASGRYIKWYLASIVLEHAITINDIFRKCAEGKAGKVDIPFSTCFWPHPV